MTHTSAELLPSYAELQHLENLAVENTSDCKLWQGGFRVWLSRCSIADGEPFEHTVYVERLTLDDDWRWIDVGYYDGENPPEDLPGVKRKYLIFREDDLQGSMRPERER